MSRRPSFTNVIVIALCAIATMFAAIGSRSTSTASRAHAAVSVLTTHAKSQARVARPTIDDRGVRTHDGSAPAVLPAVAIASALPSIAPLESTELRPFTWIEWRAPARARADLMVFLN